MTPEEKQRLLELIANPPPGSKLAGAKEYVVDFSLIVEALGWTPTERLRNAQNAANFYEELRRAGEKPRALRG